MRACHKTRASVARPGRGGTPSGEVVGTVEMPANRTVNDLRVEPGLYEVRLDSATETFWMIGHDTFHFPAALKNSGKPVDRPSVRLIPAGGKALSLDADVPPDRNWGSYKSRVPI